MILRDSLHIGLRILDISFKFLVIEDIVSRLHILKEDVVMESIAINGFEWLRGIDNLLSSLIRKHIHYPSAQSSVVRVFHAGLEIQLNFILSRTTLVMDSLHCDSQFLADLSKLMSVIVGGILWR